MSILKKVSMATTLDDTRLDPNASSPRRPRSLSGTQVMFAVIVAIALMLAVNFSSRVAADRELRRVRDAVEAEIEQLKREQAALIDRLNFVQSDAFIEQWARSQGRMVREGEVLLVLFPMMESAATPTEPVVFATPAPLATETPPTWHAWWALFFDVPPPGSAP